MHSNGSASPRKIYETTVAEIVDSSNGSIEDMEMLKRRISRVKRTPARGALKIQKKEIGDETKKAQEAISTLLSMLSTYYIEDKKGILEL